MSKAPVSNICIYLPADAPEQSVYAASELKHYLGLISAKRISVGQSTEGVCIRLVQESLGDDDSFSLQQLVILHHSKNPGSTDLC